MDKTKQNFVMGNLKQDFVMDSKFVATCSFLGKFNQETQKYEKHELCGDLLNDLIHYLKKDDSKTDKEYKYRRSIDQIGLVANDLIPMMNTYGLEDIDIFDKLIKLLQNITVPTLLLFDEKIPTEKLEKQKYLELVEINRCIKVAFGSSKAFRTWNVFSKFMTEFISLKWEERDIERRNTFERILVLIRNLLQVPLDSTFDRNVAGELNAHDRLIVNMDKAGIFDIILVLVSSEDEVSMYCFHILEIAQNLLREQNAKFLAKCYDPSDPKAAPKLRSGIEKESDDHELQLLVTKEREKSQKVKPFYSRFKEATFQVTNLKSLSDKNLIVHKLPQNFEFTTLGYHKQKLNKGRNRANLLDSSFGAVDGSSSIISRSSPEISRILSKFCHEFLNSYNDLMVVTEMNLSRAKDNKNDESYYLWAAAFFMEFNRSCKPDVKLVSQTFSVKTLHDFHVQIDSYLEKLKTEKKIFLPWSRRLHYALKAYREVILTLAFSESSKSQEFAEVTKAVKTSVFHEDDYRDLLLMLIKEYNPIKMTRGYLVDLVLTNHMFLKLLTSYCSSLPKIELKPKKRRAKKKKQVKKPKDIDLDKCWEDLETGLTTALEGLVVLPSAEDDEDVLPIDTTVDFEPDVQKTAIAQRINRLLIEGKSSTAVALFRNSRGSWPDDENNLFGTEGCSIEEELDSLKKILMSEKVPETEEQESEEEQKSGSDIDEDEKVSHSRKSNQLTFNGVFQKYCHTKVIQAYTILLKDFERNSMETNHAIVRMFHRMAVDLGLHGMFYQVSIFRIFQNILKMSETNESTKELVQFAKFIVKKLVATFPKNDMLLVEILFWKTAAQAIQLDAGYSDERNAEREDEFPVEEAEN